MKSTLIYSMTASLLLIAIKLPVLADSTEDMAKKSQNPVGDIISLPLENNLAFGVGEKNTEVYMLTAKPVYPTRIGNFNLINRFILPFEYQGERVSGEGTKTGLGNLTYQAFFSPVEPGDIIWGVGPVINLPTHTDDRLGTDKWSAGPALLVLAKPGHWLFGGLAQHFWSFAGDSDDEDINLSSFQYFINYNLDNGLSLTSNPTMTANWSTNSSNRFTIPVGGVGKLVRFGKLPVDFKLQGFLNAQKPEGASEWALQFQIKFLFPK